MTESIKLNFINKSNDTNNSSVVIFQQNVAQGADELAVAWRVIENCAVGNNHPFVFPMTFEVGVSDDYGNNYTMPLQTQGGQLFHLSSTPSGAMLTNAGTAISPDEIHILNALPQNSINTNIYKDGKLLAIKSGVAPQQKAVFKFKPTIWIGAVSQVVEGKIMDPAIISQVNTELSLDGITEAEIIMTGGGTGADSEPFVFTLDNVVRG